MERAAAFGNVRAAMHPRIATAVRRTALLSAALAGTLSVHVVAAGHIEVATVAPFLWIAAVLAAAPLSAFPGFSTFRARSPLQILALLVAVQIALHVAMSTAPGAFGLMDHHPAAPFGLLMLVAHAAVALVLCILLSCGERILAAAIAAVEAILGSARMHRPAERLVRRSRPAAAVRVATEAGSPRSSRGPPARSTSTRRSARSSAPSTACVTAASPS